MNDWFLKLTGFSELDYEATRRALYVQGDLLYSKVNGRSFAIGQLETPTLGELRKRAAALLETLKGTLRVENVCADVRELHADVGNAGALFQVASQFNLLEMNSPSVAPEDGVTRYKDDRTQGPACAMSAGAATIYRNYFVLVEGIAGQTRERQIDCLDGLGALLGNSDDDLWTMRNGYALCTASGLSHINGRLQRSVGVERTVLRDSIRIGIHSNVEVTAGSVSGHRVSQAFCSAIPVAYMSHSMSACEPLSKLVLEAAYEATMWAAVINAGSTGNSAVFLTKLGGGAFGNPEDWITEAVQRALSIVEGIALDVRIVSHGRIPPALKALNRA